MKKFKLHFILLFTIVTSIILYRSFSTPKLCETVVVLNDGQVINCKWVNITFYIRKEVKLPLERLEDIMGNFIFINIIYKKYI